MTRAWRLPLIIVVVAAAIVETIFLPGHVGRALGAVALICGLLAVNLWLRGPDSLAAARTVPFAAPPQTGAGPRPNPVTYGSARFSAPAPPQPVTGAVGTAVAQRTTVADPVFPPHPVFGTRGSRAHRLPWLLPKVAAQSGVAADEATVGALALRAASVVGSGHRCEEPAVPRQDAYRLGRDASGRFAVVAVADGVSSCHYSHIGAAVAVERAVELTVRQLDAGAPLRFDEVFAQTAETMNRQATGRRLKPADLCAAMIVAVLGTVPGPDQRAVFAWIGDVSAWRLDPRGWAPLAGDRKASDSGIESGELDACLPLHPERVRVETVALGGGDILTIATDGIGDVITMVPEAASYFARRWTSPPPVAEFLYDIGFETAQQQDDRTAVVVWNGGR